MWRLAQNSRVDTLFRSDSLTSTRQALGLMGCSERTLSFNTFRGLFQSLEAALPQGALEVEHIHSHTGEPFNEMADWLARTEREKSFYYPRQRLVLAQWLPIIPHMWTLFSQADGLPPLCANGLHAPHSSAATVVETQAVHGAGQFLSQSRQLSFECWHGQCHLALQWTMGSCWED